MKKILYKKYNDDKLLNGEKITITDTNGCTVSTYLDFKKSGLTLCTRENMSFWGFWRVVDTYISRGFIVVK